MCQFLVSVSKESSSTAEVLESISRSVRVKPENLRLAEVRHFKISFNSVMESRESRIILQTFRGDFAQGHFFFFFLSLCPPTPPPKSQVGKNRFQRMFLPTHSLDTVSSSDMLFCFEVLSKDLAKERVVLLKVQQV